MVYKPTEMKGFQNTATASHVW